ncbi:MAG: hypothetical protein ACE5JC_03415 [Candidatus Zixiibacteriota bacterium]
MMMNSITKLTSCLAVIAVFLFFGPAAFAQPDFNGEITLSYLNFDDEGNRSAARELFDTYDGFNLQRLTAFGNINPHTRYLLQLDDLNLDGRRASLNVTDINLFKVKADYRQSRLLFGPGEDQKNERKSYSGYFEIKPLKAVSGYVEYSGQENEGDRIVYDIADQGLFGALYDRRSTLLKGGTKLRYKSHQLEVSYSHRKYDDKINDELDSKTDGIEIRAYGNVDPRVKVVGDFKNFQKEKEVSGDKLKETSFGLTVVAKPRRSLRLAPVFHYRTVSGEPQDPEFSAYRFGLDADYTIPQNTTFSGGVGYEARKAADFKSNLLYYSVGARSRLHPKVAVKVSYSGSSRRDPDNVLITGKEERTRIKGELDLHPCEAADIKAGYKLVQRENSNIDTKSETGSFYGVLSTRFRDRCEASLQANRSDVEFTWGGEKLKYKYSSVTGTLRSHPTPELAFTVAGTYYIYDDDVEQDKLDVTFGASYRLLPEVKLGVSYRRYEIDGYRLSPTYYEANLIKGELTFNLTNK